MSHSVFVRREQVCVATSGREAFGTFYSNPGPESVLAEMFAQRKTPLVALHHN